MTIPEFKFRAVVAINEHLNHSDDKLIFLVRPSLFMEMQRDKGFTKGDASARLSYNNVDIWMRIPENDFTLAIDGEAGFEVLGEY